VKSSIAGSARALLLGDPLANQLRWQTGIDLRADAHHAQCWIAQIRVLGQHFLRIVAARLQQRQFLRNIRQFHPRQAGLPHAELKVIPGCAHVPQLQSPRQFLGALKGFLL